jgi:hypothetical protein
MYWILEKRDDAIMGYVSGRKEQRVAEGPFDSFEKAFDAKQKFTSFGSYYYTIVESDELPGSIADDYEFVDAGREFEDVAGW